MAVHELERSVKVTVRFTGSLRSLAGCPGVTLSLAEGATLGNALDALCKRVSPSFGEKVVEPLRQGAPSAALLLHNRTLRSGAAALDGALSDGDVLAFVTPMEGG
jgi:molybdopterin converting factor small subunit